MADWEWFLTAYERDNPASRIDGRHPDGQAWSTGNAVEALVHGSSYFPALKACVEAMQEGDLLMFTDWRGDPDQLLDGPGTEVSSVFAAAAGRNVIVKGLIWRSHLDRLSFSAKENRHLGEEIEAAGGECLLDMRVRPGGSHHQKFVILRHPTRPKRDIAFVGGIDLCHSRFDDATHAGDGQRQPMAAVYGARPPWHDVQLALQGPAVADVETAFRERWQDPTPLTRNPLDRVMSFARRDDRRAGTLPAELPQPAPQGTAAVQVLRTYPNRIRGYPFAPRGERSVARAYDKAVRRAHSLIYLEDQYFWSTGVVDCFAEALQADPNLQLIIVIPRFPDQDGRLSEPPNVIGRLQAVGSVRAAAPDRVGVYSVENHAGTPVYVHAKVTVIDDVWASVGSDNVNRRSWTHDSELSCAVIDSQRDDREPTTLDRFGDDARRFARNLRLRLAREHLDRADGRDEDLIDPRSMFAAFARSAERLQHWHDTNCAAPRPAGRLQPYPTPTLTPWTRTWSKWLYRTVYDPDGRPPTLRRSQRF